jgi:DNA-binding response OmpR family regulator
MAQAKILLVDDIPDNIRALFNFLSRRQFHVLVAQDGESTLHIAENEHPDIILLDVMMPGMDGFETCELLKHNPQTIEIPVIFMTALTESVDKVKAFKVGAVDYITKPVNQEEILARLHTHLSFSRLQRELRARNEQLDSFAYILTHGLKNPLRQLVSDCQALQARQPGIPAELAEMISRNAGKAGEKVEALLLLAELARPGEVASEQLDMRAIVARARQRLQAELVRAGGEIREPARWLEAVGHAPWVEEIWFHYLRNALKYGNPPLNLELGCEMAAQDERIRFWVEVRRAGRQAALSPLFTGVFMDHPEDLGLYLANQIAARLNGQAGVEDTPGGACRFYFCLPTLAATAEESQNPGT